MNATAKLRRRAGRRVSSALWGVLVMGAGGLMIATLSGYEIDLQLIAIIVLGALGAWLLLSAAMSGLGRQKEIARATAPIVEEPAALAEPATPAKPKTPATTTEPLEPDTVSKPAKSAQAKTTKPAAKKPGTKKAANKKPADSQSAD